MQKRAWTGLLALAALLGHVACGSTTSGGGNGAVVSHDAATSGDIASADAADDAAADDVAVEDIQPDVAIDAAPDVTQPVKTVGALVNPPLDAPLFTTVVDSTAAKVTPDALQGHWTVLWFYPAASTAG